MVRAVRQGGKARERPCTATLENPADPGRDPYPSAWLLPAIADILNDPAAEKAIHNICRFGPPHWKEQCWAGFMPGLKSLDRRCICKVPHLPLHGKEATQAAASYPPQLCEEYAELWLDAVAAQNHAPAKVLESDACVYQKQPSKKETKEMDNLKFVGGLRRPCRTLHLVPGWECLAVRLWSCVSRTIDDDADAATLAQKYGQSDFAGPTPALVEKVQAALRQEFALEPVLVPRPEFGLPCAVRADILCGILRAAGDPDADVLQDWLVHGAPLGMDRVIETTGIFPPADHPEKEDNSPTPELLSQDGLEHYKSVRENPDDAHREFERYKAAQIAVDIPPNVLTDKFPRGHINKLGLIIKDLPGGKRKVRLVVDMRRSRANARGSARATSLATSARCGGRLDGPVLRDTVDEQLGQRLRLRERHGRLLRRVLPHPRAPRRAE